MKWIKKYEELNYSTYRSAANKLEYWNKSKRANLLFDYADEKEFDVYNLHISRKRDNNVTNPIVNNKFTLPKLIGVYYGDDIRNNLLYYKGDTEDLVDELIQKWSIGQSTLSIALEFGFKPMKETIIKVQGLDISKLLNSGSHKYTMKGDVLSRYTGNLLPTFSIVIQLCEYSDGLENWNEGGEYEASVHGYEYKESTTHDMYRDSKEFSIKIDKPKIDHYYGIFSDRRSALKFKKYFNSVISDDRIIDIKDKIYDVVKLLGEPDDIDNIIKKLSNIRHNSLYDDELSTEKSTDIRWFGTNGKIIN